MSTGGIIGKITNPTKGYAVGVWNINDQFLYKKEDLWPSRIPTISTTNLFLHLDAGYEPSYSGSGTIWSDLSGTNNTGNLVNTPTYTAGVAGNFEFNSASSQQVTTTNSITNPTAYTLFVLFKTSTASGRKLIGFEDSQTGSAGNYDRHLYVDTSGNVRFGIFTGTTVTLISSITVTDDTWRLVAATYGGEGTTGRLYINGVSDVSRTFTNAGQSMTGWWRIAGNRLSGWTGGSDGTFTGNIAAVGTYSRALSNTEILDLYNAYKSYYPGL